MLNWYVLAALEQLSLLSLLEPPDLKDALILRSGCTAEHVVFLCVCICVYKCGCGCLCVCMCVCVGGCG